MKYYVTADIHGFYSQFHSALEEAGYFSDSEPHKLIILGDLFDRGSEAEALQTFVMEHRDEMILIRGNHEDLFAELVTEDEGVPYSHHISNGTYQTALQLTGYDFAIARIRNYDFAEAARKTPYYSEIMPSMVNWFETENYVFVHGWIPCIHGRSGYSYYDEWREASDGEWSSARWYNGMDAVRTCMEEKTIVCGHWHTSYGHSKYEGHGSEFGADADFSPYYAPGIIALDACTGFSGRVNIITIED
mgnify:CR=1 FL=1